MMGSSTRAALILTLGLAVGGCGRDPVAEVPGHLDPGNAIRVSQAVGNSGNANDGMTIGSTGNPDWVSPNVPIMVEGTVDLLYFYPTESRDGEALRDGHWCYVKVHDQSFRKAHHQREKNLFNELDEPFMDRSTMPRSMQLDSGTGTGAAAGTSRLLPRMRQGDSGTSITVVEAQEDGTIRPLGRARVPGEAGEAQTLRSAYDLAEQFNQQVRAQRQAAAAADEGTNE